VSLLGWINSIELTSATGALVRLESAAIDQKMQTLLGPSSGGGGMLELRLKECEVEAMRLQVSS
jgi:hypothetical protein